MVGTTVTVDDWPGMTFGFEDALYVKPGGGGYQAGK